jgi:hypothetical protein
MTETAAGLEGLKIQYGLTSAEIPDQKPDVNAE